MRLDASYAKASVPFHARPARAAMDILGAKYSLGMYGNPQVFEIEEAYARLVPEVNDTWPGGVGTGLVASLDRVRPVTVGVIFGDVHLTIGQALGFSDENEWRIWCRQSEEIAARSAFACADMHDLVNGIDRVGQGAGTEYWSLAANQLKLAAEGLFHSGAVSSPLLQPICLTAELAMKGTLIHFGVADNELRKIGRNLPLLGQRMSPMCAHRDDPLPLKATSGFPNYVAERYQETSLSRLEVIDLALSAQFIAASAVRRISGKDTSHEMELNGPGPCVNFFP